MLKICFPLMSHKRWCAVTRFNPQCLYYSQSSVRISTYLLKTQHNFYNRPIIVRQVVASNSIVKSRHIHCSCSFFVKEPSKVEETVKVLKEKQKTKHEQDLVSSFTTSAAPIVPKRSIPKRIWDELVHYYHGFRLMFIDVKVSSRLAWKILRGGDLSRREHKQLVRTVSDLFRLVPFSLFIIIPCMELLLPVVIKFFPGLLPSTFQTSSDKELKFKHQLKVKIEMAKFLHDTLDEMALQSKGDSHSHTAKEFVQFFEKIRTSGEQANNEEILKFSKLFEDEITLDNLPRPQLTALCRLLELQPIGTNNFLRFQLRMKLRNLKADDQMIHKEGIDCLTVSELQSACRARGMRALGIPEERLRSQLEQWLELSLDEQIPPSLLLLSRALYLPENLPAPDQLKATLSSLSDAAAKEAKFKIGEMEGKIDNKTKLELIKKEEEEIKKEAEELKQEELELKKKEALSQETVTESVTTLPFNGSDTLAMNSHPREKSPGIEAKDHEAGVPGDEAKLSKKDFEDIEDALENISNEKKKLLIEKEELEELKEEMADYKQDIEEFKDVVLESGRKEIRESKAALRLSGKVTKMITKMDKLLGELTDERKSLQQQIDNKVKEGVSIGKERDDIININELVLAIRRIQKVSDDTRLQQIADVLEKMDVDHDGAVEVDHVLKVIELLGEENVKVTGKQMDEIIELLLKEDMLELEEKNQRQKQSKDSSSAEDVHK